MIMLNYTLPEFVFLDGNSHLGDTLKNRTVIMHIRTCSVIEIVPLDEIFASDFKAASFKFDYINQMGITEQFLFAIHITMEDNDDLKDVFEKCRKWYCDYLKWEDRNIITDETAKHN